MGGTVSVSGTRQPYLAEHRFCCPSYEEQHKINEDKILNTFCHLLYLNRADGTVIVGSACTCINHNRYKFPEFEYAGKTQHSRTYTPWIVAIPEPLRYVRKRNWIITYKISPTGQGKCIMFGSYDGGGKFHSTETYEFDGRWNDEGQPAFGALCYTDKTIYTGGFLRGFESSDNQELPSKIEWPERTIFRGHIRGTQLGAAAFGSVENYSRLYIGKQKSSSLLKMAPYKQLVVDAKLPMEVVDIIVSYHGQWVISFSTLAGQSPQIFLAFG